MVMQHCEMMISKVYTNHYLKCCAAMSLQQSIVHETCSSKTAKSSDWIKCISEHKCQVFLETPETDLAIIWSKPFLCSSVWISTVFVVFEAESVAQSQDVVNFSLRIALYFAPSIFLSVDQFPFSVEENIPVWCCRHHHHAVLILFCTIFCMLAKKLFEQCFFFFLPVFCKMQMCEVHD